MEDNKLLPQVHIVEASAGSGKTYALAKRYLKLLLNPSQEELPLKTILAITFTNKASAEMKERIMDLLKKIALDRFSDQVSRDDILGYLGLDQARASELAYKAIGLIIRNYNFFQVQTIDSFINSVLSGCAFKVNLSANFRIRTNAQDYIAYELDRLIDCASADSNLQVLFSRFLSQYLELENKVSWLPKQDMLLLMKFLFNQYNTYGGYFSTGKSHPETLINLKKEIHELMKQLSEQLPEGANATFRRSTVNFLERTGQRAGSFSVDSLSEFLLREEPPLNKGCVASKELRNLWYGLKERIRSLVEQEAASSLDVYIDLFTLLLGSFRLTAEKEDLLFLEELNSRMGGLLGPGRAVVPEIYYSLCTRFRHFLIDEFQDTSLLQWNNLSVLIEECLASAGTLFYVGDRKQAIYRFRGGDAALMEQIKSVLSNYGISESLLSVNYRSCQSVVAFNNAVFSAVNIGRFLEQFRHSDAGELLEDDDCAQILSIFSNSSQECTIARQGVVSLMRLNPAKGQDNALQIKERIINLLKELSTRYSYGDMAILTRNNTQVQMVTGWLIEAGVPVESEYTLNIREHPLVKEILSLIVFLDSPSDDIALAAFLSGDILPARSGIGKNVFREFLLSRNLVRVTPSSYLYRAFNKGFPGLWEELFDGIFRNSGFLPLYDLVSLVLSKFMVIRYFPESEAFFMKLLELLKEKEEEVESTRDLLKYLENANSGELSVNIGLSDSVKVLTVHKSKGLQFRTVLAPFITLTPEVGQNIVWAGANALGFVRMRRKHARFSRTLLGIYRQELKNSLVDELNTVYVALTRPMDELHILCPSGPDAAGMLFDNVPVPAQTSSVQSEVKEESRPKSAVSDSLGITASINQGFNHLLQDEFTRESEIALRDAINQGKVLHSLLTSFDHLGVAQGQLIDEAIDKARIEYQWVEDWGIFRHKLKALLDSPQAGSFFSRPGQEVHCEQELVDESGRIRRPDRMIIGSDKVEIIDYKLSAANRQENIHQLEEYARIVANIYPGKNVEGYLLYLDTLAVEQVI